MSSSVEIPVWVLALLVAFAAVTFGSHFLMPSVRWFFRRRLERAVAQLNERLSTPIQPFKLARRYDMIQRLVYDTQVFDAIAAHARARGIPENVAFQRARAYAREIVPAFSAATYFGVAIRVARWLSTAHYDVRLTVEDEAALQAIPADATIVFVMNHRSNMDYVLVTHLVADRSALSYAVGEWARIWPLRRLFRSMGAYFIRRRSRDALYRQVLARYVQMATAGGVTQAIFPEGGLSLDGRTRPPRLGLLSYIRQGAMEAGKAVVFVPVALAYDRVLEDRVLLAARSTNDGRFRGSARAVLAFLTGHAAARLTGRFRRFGIAGVAFGQPVPLDPHESVERLGARLMARIEAAMPLLPVPLVAEALLAAPEPVPRAALLRSVAARISACGASPVHPSPNAAVLVERGLAGLALRRLVTEGKSGVRIVPSERALLRFYAHAAGGAGPALPPPET